MASADRGGGFPMAGPGDIRGDEGGGGGEARLCDLDGTDSGTHRGGAVFGGSGSVVESAWGGGEGDQPGLQCSAHGLCQREGGGGGDANMERHA